MNEDTLFAIENALRFGLGSDHLADAVASSLDAAWAEADAALPEGWAVRIMMCTCTDDRPWKVSAGPDLGPLADPVVYVEDTPAAALRALAAKLRDLPSD